jgi:hypothetical protein
MVADVFVAVNSSRVVQHFLIEKRESEPEKPFHKDELWV